MIGREHEKTLINKLLEEDRSHFIAVYGRRRIGKTYLIREHLKDKFTFYHTGLANVNTAVQLEAFYNALRVYSKKKIQPPKTWIEAFELLKHVITHSKSKKKIVFLDELPWLDTPRSNFLSAFEHFWNSWASARIDIMLIVCGSATSWIVKKLFNNKGGFHNRVSHKINLQAFTLAETKLFLRAKGIVWEHHQIAKAYMCMGGIPFYLDALEKGKSIDQCIDQLYFNRNGLLVQEFENLYASLFKNAHNYIEVISAIAKKRKGLTRDEIVQAISIESGGTLTNILHELELSDFIRIYTPFDKKSRDRLYQLVDFYSLFYYNFLHHKKASPGDWLLSIDNPRYRAWSGYAFEMLCLVHTDHIKKALGISGVQTGISCWQSKSKEQGAQIDLVIDRRDQIIHLFEIKNSVAPYSITKKYAQELQTKLGIFKIDTKTRKAVFLSMLTSHGLALNEHSSMIQNSLLLDDLF